MRERERERIKNPLDVIEISGGCAFRIFAFETLARLSAARSVVSELSLSYLFLLSSSKRHPFSHKKETRAKCTLTHTHARERERAIKAHRTKHGSSSSFLFFSSRVQILPRRVVHETRLQVSSPRVDVFLLQRLSVLQERKREQLLVRR